MHAFIYHLSPTFKTRVMILSERVIHLHSVHQEQLIMRTEDEIESDSP